MRKLNLVCIALLISGCTSPKVEVPEQKVPQQVEEERTVSLTFTGDILIEDPLYYWMSDGYTSETYQFKEYFNQIKPYFQTDLVIGNQEVPIGGRELGMTGINFSFNAPEEIAPQLKELGFDILTFANNHTFDRGMAGIKNTLAAFQTQGIKTTGAYTKADAASKPLIVSKNGVKIAFLAYTYDTNQAVADHEAYAVNTFLNDQQVFDQEKKNALKSAILQAKQQADAVIVAMHWGTEFTYALSQTQQEAAAFLNECGVDIIIGNHPHTLQTVETLSSSTGYQTFVMYSLGNFVSAAANVSRASEQFTNMYEVGGIVQCKLIFDPNTKELRIEQQKLIPIVNHFMYGYTGFQLIPFSSYTEELAAQHYQRLYSPYFTYDYLKDNLSAIFDGKINWE